MMTVLRRALVVLALAGTFWGSSAPMAEAQEESKVSHVLIQNVNIYDGRSDTLTPGHVLIENHLIKEVGAVKTVPPGTAVIDGKGGTLMPGMIDMHSHLVIHEGMLDGRDNLDQIAIGAIAVEKMRDYLDQGFTTARDAGGNTLGLAKAVREGRIPGPRIYPSGGFLSQVGGHADTGRWNDGINEHDYLEKHQFGYIVSGRAQVLEAARHNLRAGATQIKIMGGGGVASEFDPLHMTQFTLDEMKAAVEVAEDYGTYCLVHAYHDRAVNRAIDAGVKCIEHNFLASEKTIIRMKEEGIALSVQGVISLESFADPDSITFFSADQKSKAKKVNSGAAQMLKWALKHDLIMATGGDMFDKANANRQVDNMIVLETVGFTPAKILKMATGDAAEIISWCGEMNPYKDGPIGVIEAGAYADILVVDGNPLSDLTVLKDRNRLQLIMKDGGVWKNTLVPPAHPQFTPSTERHNPAGT